MRCRNVNIVGGFIYDVTLSVRGHVNSLRGHVNLLRFVERTCEFVERTREFVGTCSSSHMLSKIQYDLCGEATTGPRPPLSVHTIPGKLMKQTFPHLSDCRLL